MANNVLYDTLPSGRWFRLLRIHPGRHDDPLRCDLIPKALDEAPTYTALSYVWGDPTNIGYVTCSGIETPLTLSLVGGLRQLRNSDRAEMVWADAICINQADIKEKTHQVNMMGTIYDEANGVLVWLGDDIDVMASCAFGCLPTVNQAVLSGAHRCVSGSEWSIDWGHGNGPQPLTASRDNMDSLISDRQLEAVTRLYQLPWFTRVWVLQEVGLATRATACWGDCRIDFSEIALFIWFAMHEFDVERRVGEELKAIMSACPYNAVYGVWSTYNKEGSWVQASPPLRIWADHLATESNVDFLLVLEASRKFNATDPRDHVFAFLGHPCALLPGTQEPLVKANYELSLEQLHRLVAQRLAKTSLNFLVQAENTSQSIARTEHCSWIPRWDMSSDQAPAAFWEAWDASLRASKRYAPPIQTLESKLGLSALLFDTVEYQNDVMRSTDFERWGWDGSTGVVGPTGKIGFWIEECWALTERASEATTHKYRDNHVLAFASVLGCEYVPKDMPEDFFENTVGDFCQACLLFNPKFYNEKVLPLGLTYPWKVLKHRKFAARFQHAGSNRRFFITKGGYWGLGPAAMQEDDVCAVLLGADVPFVLRSTTEPGTFRLVGQAYIYGVMYGELMAASELGGMNDIEEICIV